MRCLNVVFNFLGVDKMAEFFIQKGVDVNNVGRSGHTALHHVAKKGKTKIVQRLQ